MTTVNSIALSGIKATPVQVEATPDQRLILAGVSDPALRETLDRVRCAASCQGIAPPQAVIAVRPAFDSGKYNPQADMAIHAALASMEYGCLPRTDTVFLGEISILGTAERTRGLLPMLLGAIEHGFTTAVVPQCQVQEARLAEGIQIVGVTGLRQLRDFVQTGRAPMPAKDVERPVITYPTGMWEQIGGQGQAKRALEVAAAGHHHTLMLTGSNTPLPEVMVIGM